MNKSIATLSSPEFINISSVSPMISKCDVKVLYIGQNRNRSSISKDIAERMAQTLPGCPIVGYYIENKEDFGDHGDQMIIDGEGVHFKKLTKPYGFVPLDAKVWFQDFEDIDEFGNSVIRKYLMTEGYLWTGQFEECKRVIEGGNPQSMELDDKTLKGHWAEDTNRGIDFFIINDATISKLCILGEDVEPCFEGASVTSPTISSTFTKLDGKDDFSHTLFTMLKELRELKNNKGGYSMENEQMNVTEEVVTETVVTTFEDGGDPGSSESAPATEAPAEGTDAPAAEGSATEAPAEGEGSTELPATEVINGETVLSSEVDEACANVPKAGGKEEYACAEEDEDKNKKFEKKDDEEKEDSSDKDSNDSQDKDEKSNTDENEDNKEEDKKKYELLENEYNELKAQFSLLESEVVELRKFKSNVEDAKKDELINSFYMLSEEDKKDVVENKTKYSLEDIEAKLSVICVRKRVSFNSTEDEEAPATDEAPLTFNLEGAQAEVLPAWLQRVHDIKNLNN